MANPLLFGLGPGNIVTPLLVDAAGNVLASVPIPTAGDMGFSLDADGRLYISGRYDNTPLSMRNEFHEHVEDLALAAGTNTFDFTPADIDQVIHVSHVYTRYVGTITSVIITWGIWLDPDFHEAICYKPVTSNVGQSQVADLYVPAGWNVRLVVAGATLNNDIFANYFGYQMWIVP